MLIYYTNSWPTSRISPAPWGLPLEVATAWIGVEDPRQHVVQRTGLRVPKELRKTDTWRWRRHGRSPEDIGMTKAMKFMSTPYFHWRNIDKHPTTILVWEEGHAALGCPHLATPPIRVTTSSSKYTLEWNERPLAPNWPGYNSILIFGAIGNLLGVSKATEVPPDHPSHAWVRKPTWRIIPLDASG